MKLLPHISLLFTLLIGLSGSAQDFYCSEFGSNGVYTEDIGQTSGIVKIAEDGQQRIWSAGFTSQSGVYHLLMLRTSSSGEPDLTFNTSGNRTYNLAYSEMPIDIVSLPNGGVLLAGYEYVQIPTPTYTFVLWQFDASGNLDNSFGSNGRLDLGIGGFDAHISALQLDSDGSIFVSGTDAGSGFVAKLSASGQFDIGFGINGIYHIQGNAPSAVRDIKILNQCVYAAGYQTVGGIKEALVMSLTKLGDLNTQFESGQIKKWSELASNAEMTGLAYHSDGLIGIANNNNHLSMVNFSQTGLNNSSFGTNGFIDHSGLSLPRTLEVLSNGRIVGAWADEVALFNQAVRLMRFNPDGSKDFTLDTGSLFLDISPGNDYMEDFLVLKSGRLILAGSSKPNYANATILCLSDKILDLDPLKDLKDLTFFPNPVSAGEQVQVKNVKKWSQISIYEASGRLIKKIDDPVKHDSFESPEKPGYYYLHLIESSGRNYTVPFIVH